MVKLFGLIVCTAILVYQASSSVIDFEKFIKSMERSDSDSKFKYLSANKDTASYKIPHHAMDEFRTLIDRLETEKPLLNLDDESAFNQELKVELEAIRKVLRNEEQESNDPVVLRAGQQAPISCGKYGCCNDNTPADSTGKEGCARRLCEDLFKETCRRFTSEEKERLCGYTYMQNKCPFTCSSCKYAAAPISNCMKYYPAELCCWDGSIAKDRHGRGCKPCLDVYKPVCKTFKNVAGGCHSNSWRIRSFMNINCPDTCGYC